MLGIGCVAFADRLLLNKVDLLPEERALLHVEARLRGLNKYAPIVRCCNAEVAPGLTPHALSLTHPSPNTP